MSAFLLAGFAEAERDLSEADQSRLLIRSMVFTDGAMDYPKQMPIDLPRTAVDVELDDLADDADREMRRRLREECVTVPAAATDQYEWLGHPGEWSPGGCRFRIGDGERCSDRAATARIERCSTGRP
ncbi:hypothetical protein [Frigoribacterium sp. 2355]